MKLFIPCKPEDVRIHPHGQGVLVELRPEYEARKPAGTAILFSDSPMEVDALSLSMDLKDALPLFCFEHGHDAAGELILVGIYQPE